LPFQPRIAILVPAADYEENWQPAFARKFRALNAVGLHVEQRVWHDPGDLTGFDLVLPLFAWGYQRDAARWFALLDAWAAAGVRMVNPPSLLRWNSDKAYLADLAARGIAVVPTIDAAQLNNAALLTARAEFAAQMLVVKPPVSGGADGTYRLDIDDDVPAAVRGRRMLIQPAMAGIHDPGEYSLFFFDGQLSHAILKRPAVGDFRVQDQFGGTERPVVAPERSHALAAATLAALPAAPAYARIDMVGDDAGDLFVMEVELIEPSLFLHHAPDGGAAFAAAINRAVATTTGE
jgi:glutathione synthase/RimK-type ligase-like ATP-grasp enzyme